MNCIIVYNIFNVYDICDKKKKIDGEINPGGGSTVYTSLDQGTGGPVYITGDNKAFQNVDGLLVFSFSILVTYDLSAAR